MERSLGLILGPRANVVENKVKEIK